MYSPSLISLPARMRGEHFVVLGLVHVVGLVGLVLPGRPPARSATVCFSMWQTPFVPYDVRRDIRGASRSAAGSSGSASGRWRTRTRRRDGRRCARTPARLRTCRPPRPTASIGVLVLHRPGHLVEAVDVLLDVESPDSQVKSVPVAHLPFHVAPAGLANHRPGFAGQRGVVVGLQGRRCRRSRRRGPA